MTAAWTFAGESPSPGVGGGPVTLVEESSFCLSGRGGDIHPGTVQGLFVLDTRLISRLELSIDGVSPEPLAVSTEEPFAATFVARVRRPNPAAPFESPVLVVRRRYVGSGMRDDLTLSNHNRHDVPVHVRIDVVGDFADVFAVKEGRAGERSSRRAVHTSRRHVGAARDRTHGADDDRPFRHAPMVDARGAAWDVTIPAGGTWSTCYDVSVRLGEHDIKARYACGQPVVTQPRTTASRRGAAACRFSTPTTPHSNSRSNAHLRISARCDSSTQTMHRASRSPQARRGSWRCSAAIRC